MIKKRFSHFRKTKFCFIIYDSRSEPENVIFYQKFARNEEGGRMCFMPSDAMDESVEKKLNIKAIHF